jgi:periplasmic divalent cation tolerance protein
MSTEFGALIVIATVPDQNLGVKIAQSLLECRLAACVHLMPAGRSLYRWAGKIEDTTEITMLIKTTVTHYAEIEATIKRLHPFEVPEVIAFKASQIQHDYSDWIRRETS